MAAAKASHVVKATMIVVSVPGAAGGETYLRQGRNLPASVPAEEIARLKALGLIEKIATGPVREESVAGPGGGTDRSTEAPADNGEIAAAKK